MTDARTNKVIEHTAASISSALDKMIADLPEHSAPQMALEGVVRELAHRQPWLLRFMMEDAVVREAYDCAVAMTPLKVDAKGNDGCSPRWNIRTG
jgi:hypothetical protein